MPETAAEILRPWHDFYLLLATVSATLIGAMFVVASIGSNLLTPKHESGIRAFLTPTVIHLSVILLAGAMAAMPSLSWRMLGNVYGGGSMAGFAYSLLTGWRVIRRDNIERVDHFWYAALPIAAYAIGIAATVPMLRGGMPSLDLLAGGVLLLLIAAIRNSWDMIIFFASRDNLPPSN
ncbi:MAG: hypothetical protein JO001_17875 [Alphaproteobacteria bacterium]|nr:hypothetical protein [Alphaproteobacteria bacterium]